MKKVAIIGIDGATFDLILPWIKNGFLPNLKQCIENGSWGYLESTFPPISCPAWPAFRTGKNPGKLGFFDFLVKRTKEYNLKVVDNLYKLTSFWEYISDNDYKVGIINVPSTYPPKKVSGFIITSILTPSTKENFTYPSELKSEINNIVGGYEIDVPARSRYIHEESKYIKVNHRILDKRGKTIKYLIKKYNPDFLTAVFTGTDRMQHFLWRHLDSSHPSHDSKKSKKYKNAIRNFWGKLDNILGEIINVLDKDCNLFIISDHGFGPQTINFYINDWLIKKGFLVLRKRRQKLLSKLGFNSENISFILGKFKLYNFLAKIISKFVSPKVPYEKFSKYQSFKDMVKYIDWSKTKAFSMSHNPAFHHIYINSKKNFKNGIITEKNYETIKEDIIKELLKLNGKKVGKSNIKIKIMNQKKIYSGPYVNLSPDIIFSLNKGGCYYSFGHKNFIEEGSESQHISGNHRIEGIFIAYGPDMRKKKLDGLKLIDIAPTILHIFNVPIPKDYDGKVIKEIFKKESEYYQRPIKSADKIDERDRIKKKILKLKKLRKI
ncbi:hypothetical protein ES703_23893 [subsurface metagenome]